MSDIDQSLLASPGFAGFSVWLGVIDSLDYTRFPEAIDFCVPLAQFNSKYRFILVKQLVPRILPVLKNSDCQDYLLERIWELLSLIFQNCYEFPDVQSSTCSLDLLSQICVSLETRNEFIRFFAGRCLWNLLLGNPYIRKDFERMHLLVAVVIKRLLVESVNRSVKSVGSGCVIALIEDLTKYSSNSPPIARERDSKVLKGLYARDEFPEIFIDALVTATAGTAEMDSLKDVEYLCVILEAISLLLTDAPNRKRFITQFSNLHAPGQPSSKALMYFMTLIRQRHDELLVRVCEIITQLSWRHQDNAKNFLRAKVCEAICERIVTAQTFSSGIIRACLALVALVYGNSNSLLTSSRVNAIKPPARFWLDRIIRQFDSQQFDFPFWVSLYSFTLITFYIKEIRDEVLNKNVLDILIKIIERPQNQKLSPSESQEYALIFLAKIVSADDSRVNSLLIKELKLWTRLQPLLHTDYTKTHIRAQRFVVMILGSFLRGSNVALESELADQLLGVGEFLMLFRKPDLMQMENEIWNLELHLAALFHLIGEKSSSPTSSFATLARNITASGKRKETMAMIKGKIAEPQKPKKGRNSMAAAQNQKEETTLATSSSQ